MERTEWKLTGRVWRSVEGVLLARIDDYKWMTQARDLDDLHEAMRTMLGSVLTYAARKRSLGTLVAGADDASKVVVHLTLKFAEGVVPGSAGGCVDYEVPVQNAA